MAASGKLLRSSASSSSPIFKTLIRFKSTSSSISSSSSSDHHQHHQHEYLEANPFLGSWKSPKNPKEAEAKLVKLRRDYAKQVSELRKKYMYEVELERQEKQRKAEARKEAIRVAKEERRAAQAQMAKARAEQRKIVEEEFRQTLMKERAQNLENWRLKEQTREEKKRAKNELLCKQSSIWIDEKELEKKILEAIVDSHPL